jgi:uncharacterized membrane protein
MSDNTNRPAAGRAKRSGGDLANILTGVLVLGGVVLAAAWYFYVSHFGRATWSSGHDVWGQLGDFIGGVTNPILTFLSLVALLMTVRLQADQVDAAREELEEARQAQRDASAAVSDQIAQARVLAAAQLRTALAQEAASEAMAQQARAAVSAATTVARTASLASLNAVLEPHRDMLKDLGLAGGRPRSVEFQALTRRRDALVAQIHNEAWESLPPDMRPTVPDELRGIQDGEL